MRNRDLFSSIFWFFVGLGFIFGGVRLGIGQWRAPGPGFLPVVCGGIMSGLSVVLLIMTLSAKSIPLGKMYFWKEKTSWRKVSFSLLSLVLYMILLNYLGYLLTSYLLINYLVKFVGKKGWILSIVVALLVSMISYLVFQVWLEVPLPKGIFRIG